jgi:hypothetical protein
MAWRQRVAGSPLPAGSFDLILASTLVELLLTPGRVLYGRRTKQDTAMAFSL